MAEALLRVDEIDRVECRRAFEERFTAERMTEEYVEIYQQLGQEKAVKEIVLRQD